VCVCGGEEGSSRSARQKQSLGAAQTKKLQGQTKTGHGRMAGGTNASKQAAPTPSTTPPLHPFISTPDELCAADLCKFTAAIASPPGTLHSPPLSTLRPPLSPIPGQQASSHSIVPLLHWQPSYWRHTSKPEPPILPSTAPSLPSVELLPDPLCQSCGLLTIDSFLVRCQLLLPEAYFHPPELRQLRCPQSHLSHRLLDNLIQHKLPTSPRLKRHGRSQVSLIMLISDGRTAAFLQSSSSAPTATHRQLHSCLPD
jgi:hypothetical protein